MFSGPTYSRHNCSDTVQVYIMLPPMQCLIHVWLLCAIIMVPESVASNKCIEDYQQPNIEVCPKNWTIFTNITLMLSLGDSRHQSEVIHTIFKYVSALQSKCVVRNGESDGVVTVKLPYKPYPCGKMLGTVYPIADYKSWTIEAPKYYAVNVTFMVFFLDEPVRLDPMRKADQEKLTPGWPERCLHNFIAIWYINESEDVCNITDNLHCSWKAPWSVIVPSHHLSLSLISVAAFRHYKMQFVYQIVEKCSFYFNMLRSHSIKYMSSLRSPGTIVLNKEDSLYNWIISWMPGYHLRLKIEACLLSVNPEMIVCDGPRPLFCKSLPNCTDFYFLSTMFHSYMHFYRSLYSDHGDVRITYNSAIVTPKKLLENRDHVFNVASKGIALYHKTWEISSNLAINIEFSIKQFTGPTEENCLYGGYGINPSRMEYQFMMQTPEYMLHRLYGPFCFSAPSVPLLPGGLSHLTLPNGTHRIVFYSFMDLFTMNLDVKITQNRHCTGHVNICSICFLALDGIDMMHIDAPDHLATVSITCMPSNDGVTHVAVQFVKDHQCLNMQHIAGEGIPCIISMFKGSYKAFSTSSITIQFRYIPELKRSHGKGPNSCSTDIQPFLIKNQQRVMLNLFHDTKVKISDAWYIHLNRSLCDRRTYGAAIAYTTDSYKQLGNPCNIYVVNRTGYHDESQLSCGSLRFARQMVFMYVLNKLLQRYNIAISRRGICDADDKIRIMYGLKQDHVVGICKEKYFKDYAFILYNTLVMHMNKSDLRFQIPSSHLVIQVVKSSSFHCELILNYEIVFRRLKYYAKHNIRCLSFSGWSVRRNQVKTQRSIILF